MNYNHVVHRQHQGREGRTPAQPTSGILATLIAKLHLSLSLWHSSNPILSNGLVQGRGVWVSDRQTGSRDSDGCSCGMCPSKILLHVLLSLLLLLSVVKLLIQTFVICAVDGLVNCKWGGFLRCLHFPFQGCRTMCSIYSWWLLFVFVWFSFLLW